MNKLLLFINFLWMSFILSAQSPGNVSTNLQLWLKADVGTNTTSNGADVTSWADQSANGYTATDSGSDDPVYNTNAINFNPGITYDGTNNGSSSDGLILGSDYITSTNDGLCIFAVVKPDDAGSGSRRLLFDFGFFQSTGYGLAYSTDSYTSYCPSSHGGVILEGSHSRGSVSSLVQNRFDFNSNNHIYLDGKEESSVAITTSQLTLAEIAENPTPHANRGPVTIGRISKTGFVNRTFYGDISEVIVYDNDIDPASTDRQKINSYLALKYGITIDQTSATDYLASDGTTIMWDATVAAAHNNDIAGIGRDDNSGLDQKQSVSQNPDAILSVGLGSIAATNSANGNSFGSDNTFFTWGNDDGSTDRNNVTQSNLPGGIVWRMARVWRTEENNGDIGNCEVQFNLESLGFNVAASAASDFSILVGSDATNFSGATATAANSINGNIISFTSVNIADGEFFTIGGTIVPLPVELVSLEGNHQDENVLLSWKTLSEINNEGFEIGWSTDNRNWQNIGFVKGVGESHALQSYKFTHNQPTKGINYYRLKQLDYDGNFEYSDIVSVTIWSDKLSDIRIFPNPAQTGELNVSIPFSMFETANLELINTEGLSILNQIITDSNSTLNIKSVPPGLYWLNITFDRKTIHKKVVID